MPTARRAFTASLTTCLATLAAGDAPSVWPLPARAVYGESTVKILPGVGFFSSTVDSDFLDEAFERYVALTFPHALPGTGLHSKRRHLVSFEEQVFSNQSGIGGLRIIVDEMQDSNAHPQSNTEESYTLEVPDCKDDICYAVAHVANRYAALRALETFSQLVRFNFNNGSYYVEGAPLTIIDEPRFPHRGLLIDTGRHWLSLREIQNVIDSMPYAKLNVLHWHIVDKESFPFQSKSRPKLWDGAFSDREKYTHEDVEFIVEYGRLRGVRVMVEFDVPGHAQSWCVGYPEICPSLDCNTPLNPAKEETFDVVQELLSEATGGHQLGGLFPEHFLHLGGDEVDKSCWEMVDSVRTWLDSNEMTSHDAYMYFVKRVGDMASAMGRRPVYWSEVYDNFGGILPKQSIIHIWKDVTNVTEVAEKGYDIIRNVGYNRNSWYLDNLSVKWYDVYENEPCQGLPTEKLCKHVLGGQGQMWGETVDGSVLENTIWPRMAAIAEKLWSPRDKTKFWGQALERIEDFRCLLLQRGVAAAPLSNPYARTAPLGPGGCMEMDRWP